MRLHRRIAIGFINIYQHTLSPDHGPLRRFFPNGCCYFEETCSDFGKRIIATEGILRGTPKLIRRIVSCRAK